MKAGSIRGRPGTVHRQLAGLALLASAAGLSIVADRAAGQEAGGDAPEDRLAHALIQGIPDGERIALHPLWGESRDIPEEDANERLAFEGLTRRAGDSVEKTILAGVPATSFFAALAKLDTSRLALIVLPYRVTR